MTNFFNTSSDVRGFFLVRARPHSTALGLAWGGCPGSPSRRSAALGLVLFFLFFLGGVILFVWKCLKKLALGYFSGPKVQFPKYMDQKSVVILVWGAF